MSTEDRDQRWRILAGKMYEAISAATVSYGRRNYEEFVTLMTDYASALADDNEPWGDPWCSHPRACSPTGRPENCRWCAETRTAGDLLAACFELREVITHDCGGSEREHLFEHVGPAVLRASDAIAKAGVK